MSSLNRILAYKFAERTTHHVEESKAENLREELEEALKVLWNSSNFKFEWNIIFIDDQIGGEEKTYYDSVRLALKKILGDVSFKSFASLVDLKEEDIKDVDIIFVDLLFNGECTGVLEILPYLTRSRGVNRFPLIIGLSHIETQEWIWAFLKKGGDGFITKEQFIYVLSQGRSAFCGFVAQCLLKDIDLWRDSSREFVKEIKLELNEPELSERMLDDEKRFLLKRIFYPYTRYLEKEEELKLRISLISGRSGAETLKVFPLVIVKKREGNGEEVKRSLHPRFVKLDTLHNIANEKYNFERYVRGALENFCGRIDDPIAYGRRLGGIAYTGIGLMEDYKKGRGPLSLRDFFIRREEDEIVESLEIIYNRILINLHRLTYTPESDLPTFLNKFYPFKNEAEFSNNSPCKVFEILEGRLEKDKIKLKLWSQDKRVYSADIDGGLPIREALLLILRPGKKIKGKIKETSSHFEYVMSHICENDSIHSAILKYIDIVKEKKEKLGEIPLKGGWYAVIHGDLNLDAVQYTPPRNFWLIDFAKTQKGFVAIDYVKLEVEIRTHLISDYLYRLLTSSRTSIDVIEEWLVSIEEGLIDKEFSLLEPLELEFYYPWIASHRFLKKLFVAINRIRYLFWLNYPSEETKKQDAWREYLYTLSHYAIETLKFENLRRSDIYGGSISAPFPLLVSLILAEKALNRLGLVGKEVENGG